ncbi:MULTISPECIES: retron St85 family effector protein [Yersinia]|nr:MULTISPECIES: retron St85 family effector protein [Yersinia]MDN0128156.1 retron St85 family effector protein [Yersinia massiliensis]
MNKNFSEKQIEAIALFVKNKIFTSQLTKKTTVFLCGGDVANEKYGRHKMAALLSKYRRYEILYPEDLFDDLLAGQGQYSLLSLENMLAEAVDVIIIFPESPGSYAELGAFSNNTDLAKKLICIQDNRFKSKKSFINYGPIRLLKTNKTGKVIAINYEHLAKNRIESLDSYSKIAKAIAIIKNKHPVKRSVENLLDSENFILPCIYLMDGVNNILLYNLLKKATDKSDLLCEIATKSALGRLISKRKITRTTIGYHVTDLGIDFVRENFQRVELDKLRLEIMNLENRSNASLSYAKVS